MPLFFFHLRDHDQDCLYEDSDGMDLPDLRAALEEACRANRELAGEPIGIYGLEFEIADSRGEVMLMVPVLERRRNPELAFVPKAEGEERRSSATGRPRYRH
jgi:hypothetical protein